MKITISATSHILGESVAVYSAQILNRAIAKHDSARLILSTGASQIETLTSLVTQSVDWRKVDTIAALTRAIRRAPIDLALMGIGENAHLAFNDPPADFATQEAYIVVSLDDACKRQQVREGWFAALEDVPSRAISMTVHQIMQSAAIVSAVPFKVKAQAVKSTLEGDVSTAVPATKLREHPDVTFLDRDSASLVDERVLTLLS